MPNQQAKTMQEIPIAYELAKRQKEISIAEFFTKNRHLLGFDNKRKALLMAVKEAVDNSLDACEEARILPEISIEIVQMAEFKYKVIIEDNGPGIVKKQIPNIFAKLLYGSKFHTLRQARGQQGIGISAAVLYAQLTTGKPAKITSRVSKKEPSYYYELSIDTQNNKPVTAKEEIVQWAKEHGTKVELDLEADYLKGNQSVDEYLKQTAVINPHVTIIYQPPKGEQIIYARATDTLPDEPKEIKPHPYGVELGMLLDKLRWTESRTLQSFLTAEFSRVGPGTAKEICQHAAILPNTKPSQVSRDMAEKLLQGIQKTKLIAPPTDCLSPIGEELLEKGLRKELKAEFYCATSRPPSVYRGNPFIIECCTGDTELILEDGQIITIKEYVESTCSKRVFSMNNNLKIVPTNVLALHKFKNKHKILNITTRTGKSLKVTANNEIPILDNGDLLWVKAEDLMVGNYIATPRIINVFPKIPSILDILNQDFIKIMNDNIIKDVISKLKNKFGSLKNTSKLLKVNYDTFKSFNRNKNIGRPNLKLFKLMINLADLDYQGIKKKITRISYVDNEFPNPVPINLPEISEELLYILGLLNSDGYISKAVISFVNKDETLHKVFKANIKMLFGLDVKRYTSTQSNISNKTLYFLLKELEFILPKLPNNLIVSWLKGYADGDGYPKVNDNGKIEEIGIATAKYKEAKLVQTLLLRLGIVSKITLKKPSESIGFISNRAVRTKKVKYDIVIKGTDNLQKFSNIISFRQIERANRLSKALKEEIDSRIRGDLIPVGKGLKNLRKENKLFQYELEFSDQTIRQIEKGRQNLTRLHLQQILETKQLSGITYEKLKLLAFSDILWDRIVSIEEYPFEEYVYDLTTENGNFLANNIIMHNCALAYGGEIPKEEKANILRFANRVPLLYQEGACAMTKSIMETNWKPYGLQQSSDSVPFGPVVIVVHMASVWVPFTSESKEAIAHYPEIIKDIKLALQECGRLLGTYVRKKYRITAQIERANMFEKYIPEVADSLSILTNQKKEKILQGLQKMLVKPEIKKEIIEEDSDDKLYRMEFAKSQKSETSRIFDSRVVRD